MRGLFLLLVVAACSSKPTEPSKQVGSAAPVAVTADAAVAVVVRPDAVAAVAAAKPSPTKPPPPTKQARAELKKRMKAGWAHQKAKEWAEAVPEFEAALVAVPADPRALAELGWSAMNAGDFVKARKADEDAIRVAIDRKLKASSYYNLGQVQEKQGDKGGALKSYVASLALRPNKTVMAAVGKLGASPTVEPPHCEAGRKPCECIIDDASGFFAEDTKCEQSNDRALKGFHRYKLMPEGWAYAAYEYLFDEGDHFVAVLEQDTQHGRHLERQKLDKLELKSIAGHQILWIETSSNDDASWATDDDGMDTETVESKNLTVCVVGDAKVPTRCPLRDVPLYQSHTIDHETGSGDSRPASSETTTLDAHLADDGTVTIKLVSGPSDDQLDALVGPHKLW